MKKETFWRIIVSLLVLWLFILLWMIQWHYYDAGLIKTNRITGKTVTLLHGEWVPVQ